MTPGADGSGFGAREAEASCERVTALAPARLGARGEQRLDRASARHRDRGRRASAMNCSWLRKARRPFRACGLDALVAAVAPQRHAFWLSPCMVARISPTMRSRRQDLRRKATSTRRAKLRCIQSRKRVDLALAAGLEEQMRACSRNRSSTVLTRMRSLTPGCRPQAADAAHHEVDLYAGARRAIERLDDVAIGESVHLGDDASRFAGLLLVGDQREQRRLEPSGETRNLFHDAGRE